MGTECAKHARQRSRTVYEDWLAWLPREMDQLFDATRNELEKSNFILSVALDEALTLSKQGRCVYSRERAVVFTEMYDRLAVRLFTVIRAIKTQGSSFGVLPNVTALSASNFRGTTAQRISIMSNLLDKVVLRGPTHFFHKLQDLRKIIEELQKETHAIVEDVSQGFALFPGQAWRGLEVLGYDLNTCTGETIIVLKSFLCALPAGELDGFRQMLFPRVPALSDATPARTPAFQGI
jgi:hypothetical protein